MKRRASEELLSEAEPATEDGKGRSETFAFSLGLLLVNNSTCLLVSVTQVAFYNGKQSLW